jgi:site-specific recombinase XerD
MHLSRHAFATLNISSGADLYTVSQLIGHKKLATTQIYAKVIDEKKRQAVDALPQLEL